MLGVGVLKDVLSVNERERSKLLNANEYRKMKR